MKEYETGPNLIDPRIGARDLIAESPQSGGDDFIAKNSDKEDRLGTAERVQVLDFVGLHERA